MFTLDKHGPHHFAKRWPTGAAESRRDPMSERDGMVTQGFPRATDTEDDTEGNVKFPQATDAEDDTEGNVYLR